MSIILATNSSPAEWRPVVYSLVVIALYIGLGALAWRSGPTLRWMRSRLQWWRHALSSRVHRGRILVEAQELADSVGFDNPSTVPPARERIEWAALWLVEVFLPTHAEGLAKSIRDLGWDQEGPLDRRDALAWLTHARATGRPSAISPGGFLSKAPLAPGMIAVSPRLDLPEVFRGVRPTFFQLGPGVTVLVARFTLADEERSCLERALRAPASAQARATSWVGHSVIPGSMVRLDRLGAERERVRAAAAAWLARCFTGVFSERGVQPSSWDLITSEVEPLSPAAMGFDDWRQGLGLGYGPGRRWSFDPPGDQLVLATASRHNRAKPRSTFTGLRKDLLADSVGTHPDLDGVIHRIGQQTDPLLALWGVVDSVREYDEALSTPRDRATPRGESLRATRAYLKRTRDAVLPASRDLATLQSLAEFMGRDESAIWFTVNSSDMELLVKTDPLRLRAHLLERLASEAARVRKHSEEVATATRAYGDLLVASSNLRLQRRVFWLTILLVCLAAATVWLAIEADQRSSGSSRHSSGSLCPLARSATCAPESPSLARGVPDAAAISAFASIER